jgi:hypothetical protein
MKSFILATCLFCAIFSFSAGADQPPDPPRNRLSLLAGWGPDGLALVSQPGNTSVTPYYAPLVGLSYERVVWEQLSVGLIGAGGVSPQSRPGIGFVSAGWSW